MSKPIASFTISETVSDKLSDISQTTGFSKSEIVDYVLRRALGLNCNDCRNAVIMYFSKKKITKRQKQ